MINERLNCAVLLVASSCWLLGCDNAGQSSGSGGSVETHEATVTIQGADPVPVSPRFFGQNYWSWVNAWGDPVALVEDQTSELGLGLLRAGGANNDTQEPEPFSHDEVDQFVAFSRAVGAEPLLQVPVIHNLSGEPATADDAAALVEYVNRTRDYGVVYFSIGNEPDLYTEQGLMDADYDAEAFCETFEEFASAMKEVDSSIQIVGPDLSWKYQSGANDWLSPFLEGCGDSVDIVAVHRYPLGPSACTEAAAFGDAASFRRVIRHVLDLMQAVGQGDKPLAFTEGNITWDGDPENSVMPASPGTFPAALWLADNLGVALEEQLFDVSYWSLSEGWTLGFFNGTSPRPALQVLKLFAQRFGSQVLSVSGSPDGVSVYAGRDPDEGVTSVFAVNKTESELELTVVLDGLPRNDEVELSVPAHSLVVATLPDDGSAMKRVEFAEGMNEPSSNSD